MQNSETKRGSGSRGREGRKAYLAAADPTPVLFQDPPDTASLALLRGGNKIKFSVPMEPTIDQISIIVSIYMQEREHNLVHHDPLADPLLESQVK